MHPAERKRVSLDKWRISWYMKGPKDSSIGYTVINEGYSLSEAKQILLNYRNKKFQETGKAFKIKPYFTWLLEYAFDLFDERMKSKGYSLLGVDIKEYRAGGN
jgi:hypothetical protein